MMERRVFLAGCLSLLAAPLAAWAEPAGKIPRIGYLGVFPGSARDHLVEAFRKGLRDLGYVERQTMARAKKKFP
jgi:putative ABC transport system substrate-binding protein